MTTATSMTPGPPGTEPGAATITEVLRRHGSSLSAVELAHALDHLLDPPLPAATTAPLSAADQRYIDDFGGVPTVDDTEIQAWRDRHVARAAAFLADALTTNEVAQRMGVHPSRVRHLSADGALYAVTVGRQNRFPRWQFLDDGQPLPGLRAVLDVLPAGVHPLAVDGFMHQPQPEYQVRGRQLSPIDWLASGGDPTEVARAAAWLGHDR